MRTFWLWVGVIVTLILMALVIGSLDESEREAQFDLKAMAK